MKKKKANKKKRLERRKRAKLEAKKKMFPAMILDGDGYAVSNKNNATIT